MCIFFLFTYSLYSPSQQCCYNTDGNLLTGVGGGSAYSVYPNNWISLLGKNNTNKYECVLRNLSLQVI